MTDTALPHIYRLLINRVDCYLTWYDRWVLRRAQLTKQVLTAALAGDCSLGIQAVSGTGMSRWTCLDADDDALLPQLVDIAQALPRETRLLERSRRGGHLWLFHSSLPWDVAHQRGQALAEQAGLAKIEVYPKYEGLHAVRLIGTMHPKTGLTYPIIEPITGEIVDLMTALAGVAPVQLVQQCQANQPASPRTQQTSASDGSGFDELITLLHGLTTLRVYGPSKASGRCPWHDDAVPSLYVKGRRFHCLACGVWGDAADVRRFIHKGIRPPS